MPIYEFECPNGDITERMVKFDTQEITCPQCKRKAKKILSHCSFKLRGGGWFADGYSNKKNDGNKDTLKQTQTPKSKTEN